MSSTGNETQTFYDAIGGYPTIAKIVDRFYEGVAGDEVLRPLYPEEDLAPAAERFTLFLVQYWGGPATYSQRRGHPRLRMRHAPFAVTPTAKDHWLRHFRAGLEEANLAPEHEAQFWDYVTHAAQFMVNTFDEPHAEAGSRAEAGSAAGPGTLGLTPAPGTGQSAAQPSSTDSSVSRSSGSSGRER